VARGEDTSAARRDVERELGNVALMKDVTRETWGWVWLERLLQDLKYAFRQLRKAPGFAVTLVFVLALGIGANTTIFSLVNALLLRPPAAADAAHLVELMLRNAKHSGIESYLPLSYSSYVYYRDHNRAFSGMLAFDGDPLPVSWSNGSQGQQMHGQLVSGNFFGVLGVKLVLGRDFLPEEDGVPGKHPVIVISHAFWQQQFGGDRTAIGRTLVLNGTMFTIVGVAPASFTGILIGDQPDFWTPLAMTTAIRRDTRYLESRDSFWLFAVGRLKPGVIRTQAQADLDLLSAALGQDDPKNQNLTAAIFPVQLVPGPYRGYVAAFTGILMVVVGLVLLIACANAANLLLARAVIRRHELAVRSALGAGRGRLVCQALTESVMLSLISGVFGSLIAFWTVPLLLRLKPASIPVSIDASLDWRVFCFAFLLSVFTGVVFGMVPALRSPRRDLVPALRDEVRMASPRRAWLRDSLVIAQITVCLVLLIGAGLCVRSLLNARSIDPGFKTHDLVLAQLDPGSMGYTEAQDREFYQQLLDRVRALPGVRSASISNYLPLGTTRQSQGISVDGYQPPPGQKEFEVQTMFVRPEFFKTMGIAILGGRDFTLRDNDSVIDGVVINDAMARRFWPGRSAIGQRFKSDNKTLEVIGVVTTGKYQSLSEEPQPFLYRLLDSSMRATLVVRTQGDEWAVLRGIRKEIRTIDPNVVPIDMETISQYMALPLFPAHTTGVLLSAFGVTALLLAVAGLYGVISYSVSQRTHEIGLRMALGADQRTVLKLILRQGARLTLIGIGVGLLLSFAATRVLSGLLYGVKATDPITFVGITLLLILVALASCYLPARRAAATEPMQALRLE
jgi:predicted permease